MSKFSAFKKSTTSLDKLKKELENQSNGLKTVDERFWALQVDKAGNGYAIIRFLPGSEQDGGVDAPAPWVRTFKHSWQGTGGWYIEECLSTIGQNDPVNEYNTELWNSGLESNKEIARVQKRKLSYISNILVVQDPSNPENNGKVFLFRYGKKIFDVITEQMNPEFPDQAAVNPFDFWAGANFRLKAKTEKKFRSYEGSKFDAPTPISEDDDEIEKIWKKEYSIQEFLDPSKFKSYDVLKSRLNTVLGGGSSSRTTESSQEDQEEVVTVKTKKAPVKTTTKKAAEPQDDDGDESDLDRFRRLAEED